MSLADSTAAGTSVIMPEETVVFSADYEPHTLAHCDAKEPTDTQAGWHAWYRRGIKEQ